MAVKQRSFNPFNPLSWLNSVPLGITLMVLTALFIAVGSGRPWLREYGVDNLPGMRYWFDLTDLQFFDAWPLKVLMGLLIANLVVVTWTRIPLTPPRYGVWCVHAGIITLILGTSFYYNRKIEGRVRLYTNPATGLGIADHFYDKDERALYLKVGNELINWYPLPMLPKFKDYDEQLGNASDLVKRGLSGIDATLDIHDDKTGKTSSKNISELMGWPQPLRFDIVGYYPYADITTDFIEDPGSDLNGVEITMPELESHTGKSMGSWWLVAGDPRFAAISQFGVDLEHRRGDERTIAAMSDSLGKIFQLDVKIGGGDVAQRIFVQVGKTYPVGQTGYSLSIENYNPQWPMFGTREIVKALTLKVTSPTQTFRRMVLDGRPLQTDFKLGEAGAPPIGKRQKEPLDKNLQIDFQLNDPQHLLPREGDVKHTLVTVGDKVELVDVVAGSSATGEVRRFDNGTGDIEIKPADAEAGAPFAHAAAAATSEPSADAAANHPSVRLHLQRRDHLRAVDSVRSVQPARRDRNAEEEGFFQAAKVRVTIGDFSQTVVVPYTDQAVEASRDRGVGPPWTGGIVQLPGVDRPIQLQLGNTYRELPARLTLKKFELIPYPGGRVDDRSLMLDFRSTVTVDDPESGDSFTDVAHMNSPIYYRTGAWCFFQAAYDGQQRQWTQLGVGNRPGVRVMITGCVMIFGGLLYAFYAKPIIIRRMKQTALAKAAAVAANNKQQPKPVEQLVSS
jgi:hypothetical protein